MDNELYSQFRDRVEYRVARNAKEIEEAFILVNREYKRVGLVPATTAEDALRISLFNALPETTTFVAVHNERVIATCTILADSPLGLSMETIYPREIDSLRKKGRKIAEISQFATAYELFPKGSYSLSDRDKLSFLLSLFRPVMAYGREIMELAEVCMCVMPKQENLYKFLMFEDIASEPRAYPWGNDALVVGKHLQLTDIEDKYRSAPLLYNAFFGQKSEPESVRDKYFFTKEDLEYFFVKRSSVFEKTAPEKISLIKEYYPPGVIDEVLLRNGLSR